ncbi:Glucose-1-phosphate cytidylyltransferase (CDP-glucose pyrophosphorylase) [Bradyrhizobium sp. STM 3843]|uniref:glucose-1-phosphate cytidylyltransferase n=1 Tax=Bradyrhizobium sp. STM 3843 TaxID=551947 RepID=UPI00024066A4|nr:glucose-1-phosphate cytidylyltransferase [Bradyrhizobium sp. STM 3843]CCE04768.1 Glucose-1-phosphate cytidylyltransferase (CDP-glucose pyrophosphorylase) [Bradyrhizobium sp. STM 3843]
MKAVILAGGYGTRISEESLLRPKPMIEIGGRPLLWHIMKIYAHHGVRDFIICLGYKGYVIKEYFFNYVLHNSDLTVDLGRNTHSLKSTSVEDWRIKLVDTGEATMTGGRLRRIREHLDGDDRFCCTYGDAVSDVDIGAVLALHRRDGALATVTAVQPPGRFGKLAIEGTRVSAFQEKPEGDGGWINGGFFVVEQRALDEVEGDHTVWEQHTMPRLSAAGRLSVYKHSGFWQCMDTLRDKNSLEGLWQRDNPPWKLW